MNGVSLESIVRAKQSISDVVKGTPLEFNCNLSEKYNANIYFKREDLQTVRSYKIRGAFNFIAQLSQEGRENGLVCASAGNHAQGFAYACHHFKIRGTIFMPVTTPKQKIYKTSKNGNGYVEIQLMGDTFDDSNFMAVEYAKTNNKIFVHPFDDPQIISGQGTVGFEILSDAKSHIDYLVVPIGGGGLLAGVGTYFKSMSPRTKLIGVEPLGAPSMSESLKKGKVVTLKNIEPFVDGAAVKRVGDISFAIVKDLVDDIRLIPEGRVCTTMLDLLYEDGIVSEPAGALSVDALKDFRDEIEGKNVVCIISGGNFDFERLPDVKERSLIYEGLKHYFIIHFAQRPGALREFLGTLGPDDDITRFEYIKKTNRETGPALVGVELKRNRDYAGLLERLDEKKINYTVITNNRTLFDLMI